MLATKDKCALCNKDRESVRKLITGAEASICDDCVEGCAALMRQRAQDATPSKLHCNFCLKSTTELQLKDAAGEDVRICADCLNLCDHILGGEGAKQLKFRLRRKRERG